MQLTCLFCLWDELDWLQNWIINSLNEIYESEYICWGLKYRKWWCHVYLSLSYVSAKRNVFVLLILWEYWSHWCMIFGSLSWEPIKSTDIKTLLGVILLYYVWKQQTLVLITCVRCAYSVPHIQFHFYLFPTTNIKKPIYAIFEQSHGCCCLLQLTYFI